MVQQTIDSKFSKYRLANTETGSPKHDKQQRVPLAAKKPPLQDLQNENRNMVPKSGASSQNLKESGPVVETLKVSGSKRTQSECLVKSSRYQSPTSNVNGHLVYVRRKPEPESGKSNTSHDNKSNRADSAQSRNHDVQDERIQQQSHAKDSRTCTSEPVHVPRASSEGLSSTKPSVSLAPGKSIIISPPAMNCTSEPVPVPRASSEGLSSTKPAISLAPATSNIISPPAMNCTSEPVPVPRDSSEGLSSTKPSVSLAPGMSNIISPPAMNCTSEPVPVPRASSESLSSTKPSVSLAPGKSNIISTPAEPDVYVTPAISSVDHSKRSRVQHWEERYGRLQNLLRILDQSDQEDYLQMLRPLSSVDLSRLAVELEKRSIQLSLEEAREVQRVRLLDVLGKYPKNSGATLTQQDQTKK